MNIGVTNLPCLSCAADTVCVCVCVCVFQGSLMASEGEDQANELGEEEEYGAVGGAASEDGAFESMPTEEQLPGMQQANTTKYAHCTSSRVLFTDTRLILLQVDFVRGPVSEQEL